MSRWLPDTHARLINAALELFGKRGFGLTTVAEISTAANVTERTFFRYFSDKREVLFSGQAELEDFFVRSVAAAPRGVAPLDVLGLALDAAGEFFPDDNRRYARERQQVIQTDPGLRERELLKLSGLKIMLAEALRNRGTGEVAATLAAECAVTVFHVAFTQWIATCEKRSFSTIQRKVFDELRTLIDAP